MDGDPALTATDARVLLGVPDTMQLLIEWPFDRPKNNSLLEKGHMYYVIVDKRANSAELYFDNPETQT
ncbi:MAG TPA: hypothetical protein VMR81_05670 [Patescibacteria group bacterium]|jgi:hypothetical protein|nr:hypothetical protein [Patescibacteria group bacterium]